jgi:hypothetical protein
VLELEMLELEVLELEEAASAVEEADVVQHMRAYSLELLDGTCSEESRCGASGKTSTKMSPPHGCVWLLPCASSYQFQP